MGDSVKGDFLNTPDTQLEVGFYCEVSQFAV